MRNFIFQTIWFGVVKHWFPKTGPDIRGQFTRMKAQLILARFFGLKIVIIGDSNAEFTGTWKLMRRFRHVTVNIGKAGMRADDWAAFWDTAEGSEILQLIGSAHVFWNIGGNNVLQRRMDALPAALKKLKALFPKSWAGLIPPVHASVLSGLASGAGVTAAGILADVRTANNCIVEVWGGRILDLFSPFVDPQTGEGYVGVFRDPDPVHFSDAVRELTIPFIDAMPG